MRLETIDYEKRGEVAYVTLNRLDKLNAMNSALDYGAVDEITKAVQNRVMNSEDRKEGGRAFAERTQVDWPGR